MTSKKNYFIYLFQKYGIVNNYSVKKSMSVVVILSALLISTCISFGSANAQLNFDDFMKQTQENIQSTIENSENSNNNCENNISIQTQTNENGKTTSTTRNTCDGETSTNTVATGGPGNGNLDGNIVSSEYNLERGVIVNSIYGNWSLTAQENGSKNFSASFVKQPIYLNSSEVSEIVNGTTTLDGIVSNNGVANTTTYDLSNFVSNSIQQQNNDVTYSGKIDVVKETSSNNATISDETNNYNGIGVSLTLIDNRVLFINFDTPSPLSEEFINAPIVGIAK
jgi:hypothetical protein